MKRALLLFLVIHLNVFAQDADDSVDFTGVMQVMLTVLTPSSNTIWEVDYFATEPYDDQTWERISVASDQIASA